MDKGRYFIYYWRVGQGEVLLYLGIWGTPFSVFYAAVSHTTSRRRTSAFLGGEGSVVRMASTSESSEWEIGTTCQVCQGTGVILGLEEVPPRDQETRLGSQGWQEASPHAECGRLSCLRPAGPHSGCGRLNLLLESQVPLPIWDQDELSVGVPVGDGTPSGSRSEGGRQFLLEAQPE